MKAVVIKMFREAVESDEFRLQAKLFVVCAEVGKARKLAGYLVAELVQQKGGVELEI